MTPQTSTPEQLRRECHGLIEALYRRSLNTKLLLVARRALVTIAAYKRAQR